MLVPMVKQMLTCCCASLTQFMEHESYLPDIIKGEDESNIVDNNNLHF